MPASEWEEDSVKGETILPREKGSVRSITTRKGRGIEVVAVWVLRVSKEE